MEHRTRSRPFTLFAAALIATPFFGGVAMAAGTSGSAGTAMGQGMAAPQSLSPKTISKAGKALHDVLAINQSYGAKLSATTSAADKQKLVAAAKDKATSAINSHGLSVEQYNQVLAAAQRDPAIRAELLSAAGISTKK